MRRLVPIIAPIIAACWSLTGCLGSTETVPPDHYYRITVNEPDQPAPSIAFPGVLSIATFDGDGLVRGRPLLFSSSELQGQGTLRQHNYHYWVDSPSRLLQGQLATYLKNSALADSVVSPEMRVRADYELVGKILRLEVRARLGSWWSSSCRWCGSETTRWLAPIPTRPKSTASTTVSAPRSPR